MWSEQGKKMHVMPIHVLLFEEGTWGRKGDVKAVEGRKPRQGSMQDTLVVKNAEGVEEGGIGKERGRESGRNPRKGHGKREVVTSLTPL